MADNNQRAAIACYRSLRQHGVKVHFAISEKTKRRFQFANYIRYDDPSVGLMRYDGSSQDNLIKSLFSIREKIGNYILFPSGERMLRDLIPCKERLQKQAIILPTVDLDTYEKVSDKYKFTNICNKHGLLVPDEYDGIPDKYLSKFVVKPKKTVWDRKDVLTVPFLVENARSLDILKRKELDWECHFTQKYVNGPSFYYCGLYEHGHMKMDMVQKTLVQQPGGGSVIKAKIDCLPVEIIQKLKEMLLALQWHGLLMIEFKKYDRDYYAIECNPRLWGPLQLAVDNGYDFPLLIYRMVLGEEVQPVQVFSDNTGYLWTAGYLSGLFLKMATKCGFQVYGKSLNIRFKDVWCRKDTFLFFFLEFFLIVCKSLIGLLRSFKKTQ